MSQYAATMLPFPANRRNIQGWPTQSVFIRPSSGIIPPPVPPMALAALQSDTNLLWYRLNADEMAPGVATLACDQVQRAAGTDPYVVIRNTTDGLKYRFQLTGEPDSVFWTIADAPTVETSQVFVVAGPGVLFYRVDIVTDGGLTVQLNPVLINPVVQSDDGNWYQMFASETDDVAVSQNGQSPTDTPYLVVENPDDSLRYKVSLTGTAPGVFWTIDETPTLEAITDCYVSNFTTLFKFIVQNDGGLTLQLVAV